MSTHDKMQKRASTHEDRLNRHRAEINALKDFVDEVAKDLGNRLSSLEQKIERATSNLANSQFDISQGIQEEISHLKNIRQHLESVTPNTGAYHA